MVGSEQSGKAVRFALLLALSAILVLTAAPTVMAEGSHATGTDQDIPSGETDGGEQMDTSTGEGDGDQTESGTSGMCSVMFEVTPKEAVIVVYGEGQTYLFENGVKQELPFGHYTYIINADGYKSLTDTFDVNSDMEQYRIFILEPEDDSPVRFTENTMSVYTLSFILPYTAPSEAKLEFTFPSGVEYNYETHVVTITGNETTVTVKMTATYQDTEYTDYLTILVNVSEGITDKSDIMISETMAASAEGNKRIGEVDDTRIENAYAVYLDISVSDELSDPVRINITDVLRNKDFVDNIVFGYGHDEYEVLAVHFGENSVDYPEVEIIGGQVYVTVSEFSTYGFYIYLAQEHTAFDPVYPPWSEDDDYVPFPPIVVEETEDNSVEVVACAAAAVVAALMAVFLIVDRRKG